MSLTAITLDQIAAIQHVPTFNEAYNAVAAGVLFGVKQRETVGLRFTMYGGNFISVTGAPVQIADTHIALTASTTNYIYVDQSGVISKVTVAPTGWPGPMGTGYRALYQLTVGTDAITSGTCYVVGKTSSPGPTGAQGATGATGAAMWSQRKRWFVELGDGGTPGSATGFQTTILATPIATPPTIASTSLLESIPRVDYGTGGATAANSRGGLMCTQNIYYRGNAAGRGGFDVSIRFGIDQTSTRRKFIGLIDCTSAPSSTVDPSAFTNCVGFGADEGDANFTLIHNDASGTATKTAFSNTFPQAMGAAGLVYEVRFWCDANASAINWSVFDPLQSITETGSVSTDIPANTQFLGWILYHNVGAAGATQTRLAFMQAIGNSRY